VADIATASQDCRYETGAAAPVFYAPFMTDGMTGTMQASLEPGCRLLTVDHLSCAVLQDIAFELNDAETATLSGVSGSGKTRLLRAVADLDLNSGDVRLDGVSREAIDPCTWRQRVAYLPSESRWWARTVGEHFHNPASVRFDRLGFDGSVAGWRVERLSSGERQRLAVLRLLENEPRVLLLDEPTANLDVQSIERVEVLLMDYIRDTQAACLWVTHAPDQVARIAAQRLLLDNGRISREVAA